MDTIYLDPLDDSRPSLTLIWMHGLGADGTDFENFREELEQFGGLNNVRLVLPTAPVRTISAMKLDMHAWYDLREETITNDPADQDIEGMDASIDLIQELIDKERAERPDTPIWLGGFSQGAAMALLVGFEQLQPLAGIIAFSGYVPAHPRFDEISDIARQTPVFMAHGTLDSVISIATAREGLEKLNKAGASVEFYDYPMMHEVCPDEVSDLAEFIEAHQADESEQN